MNQPTTHTEQLIVIIDGKSHVLVETKKRGIDCCQECSLDSLCGDGPLCLHLPSICCAMIKKGKNYRFAEADEPQKN